MTRHRTDPLSLLFGLVFVGVAVAAWNDALRLDTSLDLRWVWPALLIGGGLTLLAGLTRRGDHGAPGEEPDEAGWEPADVDG